MWAKSRRSTAKKLGEVWKEMSKPTISHGKTLCIFKSTSRVIIYICKYIYIYELDEISIEPKQKVAETFAIQSIMHHIHLPFHIWKMLFNCISNIIPQLPSLKLTNRTCKWMVGIPLFFLFVSAPDRFERCVLAVGFQVSGISNESLH